MELNEDTHLCLRCGQTVIGLDNYVSHRQQLCYRLSQPVKSPFLSDVSENSPPPERSMEDFTPDVDKLSANDFFLSLNLQSNFKNIQSASASNLKNGVGESDFLMSLNLQSSGKNTVSENSKCCVHESLSSGLEIPPLEGSDLVNEFSTEKTPELLKNPILNNVKLNACKGYANPKESVSENLSSEIHFDIPPSESSSSVPEFAIEQPVEILQSSQNNNVDFIAPINNTDKHIVNGDVLVSSSKEDSSICKFVLKNTDYNFGKDIFRKLDHSVLEDKFESDYEIQNNIHNEVNNVCGNEQADFIGVQNLFQIGANNQKSKSNYDNYLPENIAEDSLMTKTITINNIQNKQISSIKILSIPKTRISSRQKLNLICNMLHCNKVSIPLICCFCRLRLGFIYTFLDHLLVCDKKYSNADEEIPELFEKEFLHTFSSLFACYLCKFYGSNYSTFLNHLQSSSHCQNAASLKSPLLCFPCKEEFTASDEIIDHFTKNHSQTRKEEHPIIIIQKKQALHCCYCLSFVKKCDELIKDSDIEILQNESSFVQQTIINVSKCGYGVNKSMMDSCCTELLHITSWKQCDLIIKTKCLINLPSKSEDLTNCQDSSEEMNEHKNITNCNLKFKQHNIKTPLFSSRVTLNKDQLSPEFVTKIEVNTSKHRVRRHGIKTKTRTKVDCDPNYYDSLEFRKNKAKLNENVPTSKQKTLNPTTQENVKFLCDKCVYIGNTVHQLTRHKRSHTGERPFKCSYCRYSCSLSSQLIRHKRLHTGSRPYKCPYCPYVCNTQENLRKHILKTKKHLGKKMYPCQYCDYQCNEFSQYRDHLLKVHSRQFPNGEKDIASSSVAGLYEKS